VRDDSQRVIDIEPEATADIVLTSQLEKGADVVIDFSSPDGTRIIAKRAEELNIALVIGTTAKDFDWRADIKKSSEKVPMIHAQNFSLGVNLMFKVRALTFTEWFTKKSWNLTYESLLFRLQLKLPSRSERISISSLSKG
jgi:dihydrodipicolinate reductase